MQKHNSHSTALSNNFHRSGAVHARVCVCVLDLAVSVLPSGIGEQMKAHVWDETALMSDVLISVQFSFIYTASVTVKTVSRWLTETQSLSPQTSNGARKNCLLTGKNLDQDHTNLGREPPADGQTGKRGGAADVNIKGSLSQEHLICFISFPSAFGDDV